MDLPLLEASLASGDSEAINTAYKHYIDLFPASNLLWCSYAEWKFLAGDYEGLEAIFSQTLKTLPSVKLWKLYICYLKNSKLVSGPESAEELVQRNAVLLKAYESAILHVGLDVDSLPLWWDYIEFVKSQPATTFYEQQQVMDQTRKLYNRAILMPIEGIEMIWSSFDSYENGLNKLTAKKMLADRSPSYMLARSFCKELKDLVQGTDRDALVGAPADSHDSNHRLLAWMNWIAWERSNPLKIADGPVLHARISYAYKCALQALRLFPEPSFDYAHYLKARGLIKESESVLKQTLSLLPASLMAAFSLANFYEVQERAAEGKAALEELVKTLEAKVTGFLEGCTDEAAPLSLEAQQAISDLTLAFIQFMQYSRRTDGINAARAVFTRARKMPRCSPQLFVAAARMEYHCKKDPVVAGKIFELGMAKFSSSLEYVMEYLHHLILLNDDANTRALFERVLPGFHGDDALEIWKLYLDYEFSYGDTKSIEALQTRFKAAFPDLPICKDLSIFSRRFGYGDLQPAHERAWVILQATPHVQRDQPVCRAPKPKLPFQTGIVTELAVRLPPAHVYTGPQIPPETLVAFLQQSEDPLYEPTPVKSSDHDRNRRSSRNSSSSRRDRDHRRRSRSRSRDRRSRDKKPSSRSQGRSKESEKSSHKDIFEERRR